MASSLSFLSKSACLRRAALSTSICSSQSLPTLTVFSTQPSTIFTATTMTSSARRLSLLATKATTTKSITAQLPTNTIDPSTRLSSLIQARFLTKHKPYPNAERRHKAQLARDGLSRIPPSASPDLDVHAVQMEVFGYRAFGDLPNFEAKFQRKMHIALRYATWNPPDMIGKLRYTHNRVMRNQPHAIRMILKGATPVGEDGVEEYGPFSLDDTRYDRAIARRRAHAISSLTQEELNRTLTHDLYKVRKRKDQLFRLRRRGKGPPKKGQGKRATGAKKKR